METSKYNLWRWIRGVLAAFLAYIFVGVTYSGAGKIIIDRFTIPPTSHVIGQFSSTLPAIGVASVALACIYVGMWKRRSFEIFGWVILIAFCFAGMIFS